MEEAVITNKKRFSTPVIIVILAIVLLVIISVVIFQKGNFMNPLNKMTNTSGWQLHGTPESSYSFSYPENAQVNKAENRTDITFIEPDEGNQDANEFPPGYVVNVEEKSLGDKTLKEIADEAYNMALTAPDEKTIEEITVNGYSGYKVVRKIETESTFIFIGGNNGKYLSIYYNINDKNSKGYQEIVDQIVNSFTLSQ